MSEETTPPTPTTRSDDDKMWAILAHVSTFSGLVFPFGNIIAPLLIYVLNKSPNPFVKNTAREVLNFNISMIIYFAVAGVLSFLLIGIPIAIVLGFIVLISVIRGAMAANDLREYKYPLTMRFIS